MKTTFFNWKWM